MPSLINQGLAQPVCRSLLLLLHLLLTERFRPFGLACCCFSSGYARFDDVLKQGQIAMLISLVGLRPIALQLSRFPASVVTLLEESDCLCHSRASAFFFSVTVDLAQLIFGTRSAQQFVFRSAESLNLKSRIRLRLLLPAKN